MQVEESSLLNDNSKLKIVFLGESAVGKTSIVQNIAHGSYNTVHEVWNSFIKAYSLSRLSP